MFAELGGLWHFLCLRLQGIEMWGVFRVMLLFWFGAFVFDIFRVVVVFVADRWVVLPMELDGNTVCDLEVVCLRHADVAPLVLCCGGRLFLVCVAQACCP